MPARKPAPARAQPVNADDSKRSVEIRFEAAFLEHWNEIYRLLFHLLGDPDEAQDLALDAFLRLKNSAIRPPFLSAEPTLLENPGGWLYRVAMRLGLNALRGARRRQRYEQAAGQFDLAGRSSPDPVDLFAAAEEQRLVRQVLAEMDERQAQLLILRYSGYSYKEIATKLGLSPASMGPLLGRAELEFEKRCRLKDPSLAPPAPLRSKDG